MLKASGPVQSTYERSMVPGRAGSPATMTGWDVDTCIAEDPSGDGIGFGLAVCRGTRSDQAATLGALSGGAFLGITRTDITLANVDASTTEKYLDGDNMGVQTRGDIWVAPQTNVTAGGPVYYNDETGELGGSGIPNAVLIAGATWRSSYPETTHVGVNTGRLAIVRLG